MDISLHPRKLSGCLTPIPSKSQAHRLLICAALADGPTTLLCPQVSRDMEATAQCLRALGAQVEAGPEGYRVTPLDAPTPDAQLFCQDSGSTLRFLLPVVGALGQGATFHLSGRLPERPLSPLWEWMEAMGCFLSRPTPDTIRCQGRLRPGTYSMAGDVSSQFISGLLLAAPRIPGATRIELRGKVESRPYITMTIDALAAFGVDASHLEVAGPAPLRSPGNLCVEGDWSNAAFFLAANALGSEIQVTGLNPSSSQGDRQVTAHLQTLAHAALPSISAADIPDLVPILAVVAACSGGAVFTHCARLRLKESDRLVSVAAMIQALGGQAQIQGDSLLVQGTGLTGGTVDSCNDHRIAMAAAIAATTCPVTILGAQAVEKSYPQFWEEYVRLGGYYEQYLR